MARGVTGVFVLLIIFTVFASFVPKPSVAALTPSETADSKSCVIAKFTGKATTYNPACERERRELSTGGYYNASGWEAALQLDLAKRYNCGYKRRCYAVVENTSNGRAAILLINDNGPLYSGSYGNKGVVIDLNEASMRYLANDLSGGRYGNCKGTLPRVNVAILCRLIGQPGPLNEQDRLAWNKIASEIPNTGLPTNILSQSPYANTSPFANTVPSNQNQPSLAQPQISPYSAPAPLTASQPLPQPISSNILTAASPTGEEIETKTPESKTVSELLAALASPTTSQSSLSVTSPLKLSESVGSSNASHLSSTSRSSTTENATLFNPPQGTNTFSNTYRSPDLRWSAPTLFLPFWREIETILGSLIALMKRL